MQSGMAAYLKDFVLLDPFLKGVSTDDWRSWLN